MDSIQSPSVNQTVDTYITIVTVYTDQALVTRRGTVSLTGQERSLTLTNLPITLKPDSVRVKGSGTVAVRLLGVQTEKNYATEPLDDRVAQLTEQIQQLEDQRRTLQDGLAALELRRKFIQSLSERSVDRFSRGLAEQRVNLTQTAELLEFVGQQHNDLAGAIAQQNQALRELDQRLRALQQQLQQIKTPRPKESYSVVVSVLPTGAGEFCLEVSYTVDRASWQPLYDLRVDTQTKLLQLDYLAEVTQNTGEDWADVALILSTAKPGLGTLPPKLAPWYVDASLPPMPAAAPRMQRTRSVAESDDMDVLLGGVGSASAFSDFFEAATSGVTQEYAAETVAATAISNGGIVTFQVDGNNNIPGDRSPHKITIFSDQYPCQVEYVAIPKLVSFAYLQAIVTNPENGATLLPGQANIFRDDMFVGTTSLDNVAPGQEFKLNLGIDEGLKLERDLVERKVDKRLMQDKRLITYAYRVVVTNLREQEATLRLTEQLPVSRNERIKVRLTRSSPPIELGELGKLEWVLPLKPKALQEVTYQFTVEHPREITEVVGLKV
ncbi:mucoidy inhibitor MuiA family protein [Phormidium sp. CLA17]|uniref:mucoidy inhibitor MuiA family protein n=1 Tax=Leptolyngbya sp. Cla-17 TaxID=2803751 RepID=UPI00149295BC|nr:mucoidy inhibitor MuiA family protein [Leptolyngbya sp. Cla-17]MBM0741685.1 mucoidy inhibitor MuiA family protein [Leptolyngbya sp. Cla-17]